CSITKAFTITAPTALSATTTQTNVACNGGTNGVASVSASGGTTSYSYAWSPSGGTGATATGLSATNYTCTITDANSCSITKAFTITAPTALSATTTQTNVACFGNSTGAANVNVSGGTTSYSYSWSPSGGTGATATGLSATNYTCTITDANSCSITKAFTLTQPTSGLSATTTQTNVACNGGSNAIASVNASGGTGSLNYAWAPSGGTAATASSLIAGSYTCTISDASSCSSIKTFTITEPAILTANSSASSIACNGGSATVTVTEAGGTSPYTGDGAFSVTAGSYTYTVTDNNGCMATTTITVNQPTQLMALSSAGTILCNGGSTSVTVSETGGTSPYSGDGIMSNVTAGSYTYTVTDDNGCMATTTIIVNEPTQLAAASTSGNILCNGGSTSVTVTETGGTSPYTGDGVMSNITAGTYSYTVTDNNGCTSTTTITVTEPTQLMASASGTILCNAGVTDVTVTATGGTSPYFHDGLYTSQSAGTYTYVVTDANNCPANAIITLTEPTALLANVSAGVISCNGQATTITISASGGTPAYTGEGTFTVTAGSYTYTVIDANSCSTSTVVTVSEPNAITTTQSFTLCAGGTVTVGANTYSTSGTYTDVLAAVSGCDSTVTTNLTVNNAIDVSVNVVGATVTANAVGATYQWIDCNNGNAPISGETNQSFTAINSGNYAVIITEGSCSATSTCTLVTTSGIDKNALVDNLVVYPNPFANELTIVSHTKTTGVLYNLLGDKITEFALQNTTQTIHVGDLAPGIYYLQVDNKKVKIIKQ
ncbi:MAG TPA: T9SS type A sorting domain-containing protein, partial [Bacteroidia bacterium]|nr:T9SS type A sorting domain-containing protein [Bacteroidia bacterium]